MLASSNFLVPNGTLIVEIIAFLLVIGALAKWVLPPLDRMVKARETSIREGLEEAEEGRQLKQRSEVERSEILEEARRQARSTIEEYTRMGEDLREQAVQRGNQEYEARVSRANVEIERATQRASDELRRQLAGLVTAASGRVVELGLDPARHRELVNEVIDSIDERAATR
ncbi:MAG: F0F1 ATP synthase subunit B, partial [Acidimicrobiales bacterium]|nr:F0F1 ATP synthase subunit B [Acidimicrobiales bacterium]